MVLKLKEKQAPLKFTDILEKIHIEFFDFPLNKCDECILYLSINLTIQEDQAVCDLIYLLDRSKIFGAISLNEKYNHVRFLFRKHFQYDLLYCDELLIAEKFSQTSNFEKYVQQFLNHYTKYAHLKNLIR